MKNKYPYKQITFFTFVGFYLLYLGYLAIHLIVAVGDEIFQASVTYNYLTNGVLIDSANTLLNSHWQLTKQEWLGYGNLYFALTAYFCKVFGGFSQETYRISGVLTAVLSLLLSYFCISYQNFLNRKYIYFFILLYIFDIAFIQGIMQFRMDQMALCFALCSSLFCLFTNIKSSKTPIQSIFYPLLSGSFAACALLTTPRIAVLLVSLGIVYLIRTIDNQQKVKELLLFAVSVILVYGSWIFFKFDGLSGFIEHYTNSKIILVYMHENSKSDLLSLFLLMGSGIGIHVYQYPTLIGVIIAVALHIKNFKKVFIKDELMFISLANTIYIF